MTDDRLERMIGNLLRAGVALAAALVFAGGVWYLAENGSVTVSYRNFDAKAPTVRSGPEAVMLLGLLVLVATPVARVIVALIGFALEGDRVYVGSASIVLAVLVYGLVSPWW